MARAAEIVDQRRFSVQEYHRMGEVGIFDPDERVELIRGLVRRVSPKSDIHSIAVAKVVRRLIDVLAERASVYPEAALTFAALGSEPVPDIVVTSSPVVEELRTARWELVVEVSQSSLRHDLDVKAPLYAEAGVPEYWVVDLVHRELAVFRTPEDGDYQQRLAFRPGDRVGPSAWRDIEIDVASLLPDEDRT